MLETLRDQRKQKAIAEIEAEAECARIDAEQGIVSGRYYFLKEGPVLHTYIM